MDKVWDWLAARPYHHWAYLAIESCTPGPKFSLPVVRIIQATDRNLFYSRWGAEIASLCTDIEKHDYMPHGIFCGDSTLPPLGTRLSVRECIKADPDDLAIGCVMTNTRRKNIGLLFESFALIKRTYPKARLWLHTDKAVGEWSVPALGYDFKETIRLLADSSTMVKSSA